jgi:acyl-CoA thioesterase-1
LIQEKINARGWHFRAINAGLRGLPVEGAKQNLQTIIDRTKSEYPRVKVVLVGMQVPSNLGRDYTSRFRTIFPDLAAANSAALIPFLLDGVVSLS